MDGWISSVAMPLTVARPSALACLRPRVSSSCSPPLRRTTRASLGRGSPPLGQSGHLHTVLQGRRRRRYRHVVFWGKVWFQLFLFRIAMYIFLSCGFFLGGNTFSTISTRRFKAWPLALFSILPSRSSVFPSGNRKHFQFRLRAFYRTEPPLKRFAWKLLRFHFYHNWTTFF